MTKKRKLPKPPKISPDFTLKDIRKIRDYHYKLSKVLTPEEMNEYYRKSAEEVKQRIEEIRASGIQFAYPKRIKV
jgi:uncharacterized protein (UPF0305 family)